ncbi:response regulator transcription factor [Bifidobacterium sp. MA2]|uniref:Response regulator transcription factor n=1 Tax=Bifidobacterium santillanense TaxID=2809028 RepID=A0ABS5UMY9_9BIFI|nr:response regulator transcription factor [Bifidobacterium santillanense]MBT1172268.1 response regulator transcription factor [Bifidobacterium santillanense]
MGHDGNEALRKVRIGILDNDACALAMMDLLIRHGDPDMDVIWRETRPQRFMERIMFDAFQPDVAILDLSLNGISGVDVCREIRRRSATMNVIGVTAYPLDRYRQPLIEAGAQALVGKDAVGTPAFIRMLHALSRDDGRPLDEGFPSPREAYARLRQAPEEPVVSRRELDVLALYAQGLTTKEIASRLNISIGTVQSHTSHAAHKLGVRQRFEAIRACRQRHLI